MSKNDENIITLEIIYGQISINIVCNLTDILENRLIEFTTLKNLNYSCSNIESIFKKKYLILNSLFNE